MSTIIRIIKTASKWRIQIIIATVSLLAVTGLNLISPALVRELASILEDGGDGAAKKIVIIAIVLLSSYLLRLFFQFASNYSAHIAAWHAVAKTRADLYNHMQNLSMRYYSDKQTGQLMSRVIEDTQNFEVLTAHALPDLISSALVFVGVLIILFFINPILAVLTLIPIPFIFFSTRFLRRMRKHFKKRQEISAKLNGTLQDNFSGMREIQVFNRQEHEYNEVYTTAQAHADMTIKGIFWVSVLHPSIGFLSGLGTMIVVLFGGLIALNGGIFGIETTLSFGDITAFLLYLGLLYAPVATLSRVLEDIQTAVVSGKRVFEVLDTKSDVEDKEGAKELPKIKGEVEFKNVSFDYSNDIAVLKDVSFKVESGKMLALVGATGAGKTTITSLLARFYDNQEGQILVDGHNIQDYTLASLRNNISMVLQDVFLFHGTIAQNIAYSRRGEVSENEIIEAAKAAAIHEYIASLPDGYNTLVGERGVRLSGGQKQRIAIARAILRKAPILILDEATSAVDNETELYIQDAIAKLLGTSTIIVIAHRLSTIEKADQILVLEQGQIKEQGTHEELLGQGGIYSKMQNRKTKL